MIVMKKHWIALLAASSLLAPTAAFSEDSAKLLTQAAGSFRIIDEAMTSAISGQAEPATANTAKSAKPSQAAVNTPDEVEMAALYYYAAQKQDDRVAAEAARLRLKFPQFEMPQDLYLPQSARGVDETMLWQLYDRSDFTGIDAEIIRRKSETPDWQPTADFAEKLARRKQRVLMTEAAKNNNWTDVIQAGGSIDPATETEVDLLWMLIDAYAQTGMKQPLADIYRGILLRRR